MIHADYTDRIIYIDSSHPADLESSYMGDSRGHWEGNTLVVDVTGLNDDTWLGGGMEGGIDGVGGHAIYTAIRHRVRRLVERYSGKEA